MGDSKRQKFIDLYSKGGKRKDFIDLANELGLVKDKKMPSGKSYNRKVKRTGNKDGGLIKGQPKLTKKGWK